LGAQTPSIASKDTIEFGVGLLNVEKELLSVPPTNRVAAVPIDFQAVFILRSVLRQRSANERGSLLRDIITQTNALYLPMISFESSDEARAQTTDPLVSDVEAKSLMGLCIDKIRAARDSAEMLSHPRVRYILRNWSKWSTEPEAAKWVEKTANSASTLPLLLTAFVEAMNNIGEEGRTLSVRYRFALEEFSKYMAPDDLVERIRLLSTSGTDAAWVYRLFLRLSIAGKRRANIPIRKTLMRGRGLTN
jgi:hypothetical protein